MFFLNCAVFTFKSIELQKSHVCLHCSAILRKYICNADSKAMDFFLMMHQTQSKYGSQHGSLNTLHTLK